MSADPTVLAVVLNWNSYDDTAACLESLADLTYRNLDVVLVDNGSTDDSLARLRSAFETVDVVANETNRGFGGGMNAGIDVALERDYDYVWILNNDTVFPDTGVLETLVAGIGSSDDAGMISPVIMRYPETDIVWFRQGCIDSRSYNAYHRSRDDPILDMRLTDEAADEQLCHRSLTNNDYIPLACTLIDTDLVRDIGPLDESFFLYYEDAEFSVRARRAGYELLTHNEATIYHRVGGSTDTDVTAKYYTERNRLLFVSRYYSFRPSFVIVSIWRLILPVVYHLVKRNFENVHALVRGTIDGVRGRTGRGPYP
mgnify:CR=1 FL=1